MRAAVAKAEQRAGIDQQLADLLVIAMDVADDREEEEMVLALGQVVVGDFLRRRLPRAAMAAMLFSGAGS